MLSTARRVADTAEGLDAAHELRSMGGDPLELVHHDVSLGNIVVLYNGQVKLVDFGVAKATQTASSRTRVQGKFSYMAPEKLRGGSGDRRSDICRSLRTLDVDVEAALQGATTATDEASARGRDPRAVEHHDT